MSHDVWAQGATYEPYVGRWSRVVATEFVGWLAPASGRSWLDVGCGTGALTETILRLADPRGIVGVDRSPDYLAYARSRVTSPRVRFEVGDAQSLPVPTHSVDLAVSGLALNFVPEPARAVAEMARAVRAGGVVAAYLWDYAGRMEMMRHFWDAAVALDPHAARLDEGTRFPLCAPGPLTASWTEAGLVEIEARAIDVATRFADFDDFWTPFLGGQGPAPGYTASLTEERRALLRDRIQDHLPVAADGSIDLVARAWAIRGSKVDA
jgi:SAM-dependent methyltransferase